MKNKFRKALLLGIAAIMLVSLLGAFAVSAAGAQSSEYSPTEKEFDHGVYFSKTATYTLSNALNALPYTVEAELLLPKTVGGRAGVIFGNFRDSANACMSFEVLDGGKPRLYATSGTNTTHDVTFENVDIRSDDYIKLAFTIDPKAGTASCYINGVHKQTVNFTYEGVLSNPPTLPYLVGGDQRGNNERYFQGKIRTIAVYSDTRSADEIAAGTNLNDENLLVAYDLRNGVQNLSRLGSTYDLISTSPEQTWLADGALSFVSNNSYKVAKAFDSKVLTYEAVIWIPKSTNDGTRVGVLFGNYAASTYSTNLEFKDKASPRLYFEGPGGTLYDFHFTDVDARSDEWTHLAITLDTSTGTAKCYINGECKQTITKGTIVIADATYSTPFCLGADTRGANGYYFRGAVKSLAVFDDVRTKDEIKADMAQLSSNTEGLLALYEFGNETGRSDVTGNGYHIYYKGESIPQEPTPDEPENPGTTPDPDEPDNPGTTPDEPQGPTVVFNGMEFTSNDVAIVQKPFPLTTDGVTFEAVIQLSKEHTDRGGVILGNYVDGNNGYISFEIHKNGNPRLTFTNPNNVYHTFNFIFESVDVRGAEPVHLAISLDKVSGAVVCYVNGIPVESAGSSSITFASDVNNHKMVVGNDIRSGGAQSFKGKIGSVALYNDVRKPEEIAADYAQLDYNDASLVLAYDLVDAVKGEEIIDLSPNGNNAKFGTRAMADTKSWITDKAPVTDYLYSFAVVGDTQIITQSYSDKLSCIYDWIIANKDDKKIGYVFGLGDITNGNSGKEWQTATEQIYKLAGVIPYSVVRGNHDGLTQFNNAFSTESYIAQFDGFFKEGDATNSYRFFEIEGAKYLLITLDYGAHDDVLNWAGDIIESNPDKKVIITTHAYLYRDGTTLGQNDVCPPATSGGYNNGDDMWDKLISQYENIFLVMSGHDPTKNVVVTQTEGVNGNIVTQILTDHQGVDSGTVPTGMVTMLYFKADGSIEVETYSTIQESFYLEDNQFVIEKTEHKYTQNPVYSYANGYANAGTCTLSCECGKTKTVQIPAVIEFVGYSIKENGKALCAGYTVNNDLLEACEQYADKEFVYGVVACASSNLVNKDNKPVNADGSSAEVNKGTLLNEQVTTVRNGICVILRADDWSKYAQSELILCAYVIEDERVSYICSDTPSESALSITYEHILNGEAA